MPDPNINATADSVANKIDGLDQNGNPLGYRLVAMLYEASMFGLSRDYAFPEGSNTTSSEVNHVATLAKLLTRKKTLADKNQYDALDALMTIAKWIVLTNPHINDDEKLSVNYKPPTTPPVGHEFVD